MKTHSNKNAWHLPMRLICCFVLATSPLLSAVSACGGDPTSHTGDAGEPDDPPEVNLENLTGWLLLRRGPTPDPQHFTGTLAADTETLTFTGEALNGETVWMNLQKTGPQTLQGTWTGPGGTEDPVKLTLEPATLSFTGTVASTRSDSAKDRTGAAEPTGGTANHPRKTPSQQSACSSSGTRFCPFISSKIGWF